MQNEPIKRPLPKRDARGRLLPGENLGGPGWAGAKRGFNRTDVIEWCEKMGYNPIEHMIKIAQDTRSSGYLQAQVASELASYLLPKLKSVQITGSDGASDGVIRIAWDTDPAKMIEETKGKLIEASNDIMDAVLDDPDAP